MMPEDRKMEEKLNALCVRVVDYKDSDRLITLCTAEKGKITVKATGVKKPKAKLKFASSPLCFGEYLVVNSNGRYTLKGCDVYDNFNNLVSDLNCYYAGFSVLEWLDKLSDTTDTDTSRGLLLLAVRTLERLSSDVTVAPEKTLISFLLSALETAGYGLDFNRSAISGKNLAEKGAVCFDFYSGGIVDFSERSMDYITFSRKDVGLMTGGEEGEKKDYDRLLADLGRITLFYTGVKKNYSLEEFLKLQY